MTHPLQNRHVLSVAYSEDNTAFARIANLYTKHGWDMENLMFLPKNKRITLTINANPEEIDRVKAFLSGLVNVISVECDAQLIARRDAA